MRLIVCFAIVLTTLTFAVSGEQQRILRRVIKSTPTANQLTRIRAITVISPNAESGGVTEISSKEAASFGQRSANETEQQKSSTNQQQQAQQTSSGLKTKFITSTTSAPTTTTSPTSSSSTTTSTTTTTTTSKPQIVESNKRNKASDRQQAAHSNAAGGVEVELLSSAPSSWQTMTAVEAPAAMLIATGTRAASTSDLASAGSTLYSSEESASQTGDFLRASGTKGGSSFQQSNNEAFSRLRQQSSKTQQQQQQQQSFFYPQEQKASSGKTSFASKTPWYQTTTQRPAPLIQEQQYEQQNEQYVEQQQQQQVEYGAPAPLGQAEPFAFDFKTQDNSGNGQYRKEESDKNGVVRGSYGYTDANGIYRHVEYVADQNGFRANIKSNEPGLIGETQPASIQLAGGPSPARVTSPRASSANNDNGGDWISSSASNNQGSSADLALAPPEFESSHKPERARLPRQYRN